MMLLRERVCGVQTHLRTCQCWSPLCRGPCTTLSLSLPLGGRAGDERTVLENAGVLFCLHLEGETQYKQEESEWELGWCVLGPGLAPGTVRCPRPRSVFVAHASSRK